MRGPGSPAVTAAPSPPPAPSVRAESRRGSQLLTSAWPGPRWKWARRRRAALGAPPVIGAASRAPPGGSAPGPGSACGHTGSGHPTLLLPNPQPLRTRVARALPETGNLALESASGAGVYTPSHGIHELYMERSVLAHGY